jgi:GntR family transcriptional regulator, transcriptional repressor for pyruvate dehydrogenase complex
MQGVGLVAYVEAQLERVIAQGRLPRCRQFGSERKLARVHGVSRGTVREALRRLAARGLVVQHPGRKTRAVTMDTALTLENLGVALHDECSSEGRWWLEGFLCLKRQVLVELLADCCDKASDADLNKLMAACFALWDAGRWESGGRCVQLEFELLGLAARVAGKPGHLLLIQSLRRAFRGNGARLLPLMGGEAFRQWAIHAMNVLGDRDARALQQTLPQLLATCDEGVLSRFAAATQPDADAAANSVPPLPSCAPVSVPQDEALTAHPSMEGPGADAPSVEPEDGTRRVPTGPECPLRESGGASVGGNGPVAISGALSGYSDSGGSAEEARWVSAPQAPLASAGHPSRVSMPAMTTAVQPPPSD